MSRLYFHPPGHQIWSQGLDAANFICWIFFAAPGDKNQNNSFQIWFQGNQDLFSRGSNHNWVSRDAASTYSDIKRTTSIFTFLSPRQVAFLYFWYKRSFFVIAGFSTTKKQTCKHCIFTYNLEFVFNFHSDPLYKSQFHLLDMMSFSICIYDPILGICFYLSSFEFSLFSWNICTK